MKRKRYGGSPFDMGDAMEGFCLGVAVTLGAFLVVAGVLAVFI